ncbi:hypothetical protein [Bacillus sp. XF8]|uniref:phage tail protein n=1 Tax=Bacillus sp. XF8 TaxID=2819289 RepID=UPI001AA0157D|nr:hypothetical protein [Bacillus sp. XF8]MBO1583121.1 hypothetical protein [Bacillus sp. XF8]
MRRDIENTRNEFNEFSSTSHQTSTNHIQNVEDMSNTNNEEMARMRREIEDLQNQLNDFTSTSRRTSHEYRRSLENMGNSNSEYSQRLRQMRAEQRRAMEPHIEELKRIKLAYTELGMSLGNYQGSTRDLIREVTALGAAEKRANDAMINLNRMKMASILQTIGYMRNMTLMADRLKGNLSAMGNPFYNLSRGALTAVAAFNRFANSGNAAQLALEFVGPNASMKQLNDQIRIINTGLIRLQMTALATVATFAIFTAAMWNAAKGPDPSDIRKQQQAITDEYNKQYQKRIDEVYNFAGLFDAATRKAFSGKELARNLASQVQLMRDWVKDMKSLSGRIPVELKEELYKMGPEAAGQIRALAKMSKPELDQYVALWREKISLTNEAVTDELTRTRQAAQKKIKELQDSLKPLGIAIEKFKEVWAEALAPFVEIWGEFAAGFVNALTKVGEFVKAINEINPNITKVVGMILYLASALAVILTPLAVGIGLFKGFRAAAFAVWMVIGPLLEGMALVGPVALGIAAAIAAVVLGFKLAYEHIEPFRNAVNNVITVFKAFWKALTTDGGTTQDMLTSLGMSSENAEAILSFADTIREAIYAIKQIFTDFAIFMQGIFALFAGDEENGTALLKSLGMNPKTIATIVSTVNTIKETVFAFFSELWSFMTEIGNQIAQFWLENGDQIKQAFSNCWSVAVEIIRTVMPIIVGIFKVAWPIIKEIVIGTLEAVKTFIQGILKVILGIVKVFSSLFTGDWEGVWEGVKQIWFGALEAIWGYLQLWGLGKVLKFLGKFGSDIGKMFSGLWTSIKKIWNDALADLYVFFGTKLEYITRLVKSWGGMFKNFFIEIYDNILKGIQGKLNNIAASIGWALEKAVLVTQAYVHRFVWAGKMIIQGLIDGLVSRWNSLIDTVFKMGRSIKDTITGFFGIHSPSRLMRDMGEYMGQGLEWGLDNMVHPVVRAAQNMASAVKDGFSDLTESIQMGDVLPGNVLTPEVPSFSSNYKTPSGISSIPTSSNFGQSAMISGKIEANSSDNNGEITAAIKGLRKDLTNLQVVMEGETVGRIVTPHVNAENAVDNTVRRYF